MSVSWLKHLEKPIPFPWLYIWIGKGASQPIALGCRLETSKNMQNAPRFMEG